MPLWSRALRSQRLLACLGVLVAAPAIHAAEPSAPYAVAHERALHASEQLVADKEQYHQYRVEFEGIQGDRVPAFLYVPAGDAAKRPAVLLQYGSGGHKGVDYIVAVGRQFASNGFVVLTIDSPGRGERTPKGEKGRDVLDRTKALEQYLQYLGDYSRAIDYLSARSDVDAERIGYVGISWGAITGITFVAHDPRVKAMASMVGGGNILARLAPDGDAAAKARLAEVDPIHHIGAIAPRPLLLLNMTRDQLIARPAAEALHKAAGKGSKVVWLDADHYFNGVDKSKVTEDVVRFLQDSLTAAKK